MNELANIEAISTDLLKEELANRLEITVKNLIYMAHIWKELENRGEDLSQLRRGILNYIPMIANNQIDPRAIVNYAGQKTLLSYLAKMPIEKQSEIIDANYVIVIDIVDDEIEEIKKPLTQLMSSDIYRVFDENGIRSKEEQVKLLLQKKDANKKPVRKARKVKIENDVLLVSNNAADLNKVIAELSRYYGINFNEIINNKAQSDGLL